MNIKYWIYSIRLRTLPLSLVGIILSTLVSISRGYNFNILIFFYSCMTSVSLQILANFSNDYGDFIKGIDNNKRLGPKRGLQLGGITLKNMKNAIILFSILSFIFSLATIYESFIIKNSYIIIVILIISSIFTIYVSIKYTIGNNAYGYTGYGDIFVFIFFGIVSIQGTYFLNTYIFDFNLLLLSFSIGFFSVSILNINNMRDIKNDKLNYKNTFAVLIGLKNSKIYQSFLIFSPFILGMIFVYTNYKNIYQWLFLILLLPSIIHIKNIFNINNGIILENEFKNVIIIIIFYVFSMGISLLF